MLDQSPASPIRMFLVLLMVLAWSSAAIASNMMSADQRREEIAIVERDYVGQAPEFDTAARRRAFALLQKLDHDADSVTDEQYLLRLAEVTAQANNGHDSLMAASSPLRPASRLPLRMIWFNDRLFVSRATSKYAELVGTEVLRLGRWTPREMFRELKRYQGGKDSYRRWSLAWITHNPALLSAAGATDDPAIIPITVRMVDRKLRTATLAAIGADEMPDQPYPVGWISPILSNDEKLKGWTAVKAPAPLYLQEPERYFRIVDLDRLNALYIQFRSNFDVGDQKIASFVAEVERRLDQMPRRHTILDLRFDTGGDNTQNRVLMRDIARKTPGHIFVITGPYTFSAGIASLAAVKHDGGSKVTVIGELPGDRDHWWSEHQALCLKYSKVCVDREVGHWDLVKGCAGQAHCFSDQFDVRIRTLVPDVRRSQTASNWLNGRDEPMDEVARILLHKDYTSTAANSAR